jgi:hypothetical protein
MAGLSHHQFLLPTGQFPVFHRKRIRITARARMTVRRNQVLMLCLIQTGTFVVPCVTDVKLKGRAKLLLSRFVSTSPMKTARQEPRPPGLRP